MARKPMRGRGEVEPGQASQGFIRVGTVEEISWGTIRTEAVEWKMHRESA